MKIETSLRRFGLDDSAVVADGMFDLKAIVHGEKLGDSRRNERVLEIISGIVQGHASHTHGTAGADKEVPWAHAMGAYRFFDNDDVALPMLYGMVDKALLELVLPDERCYIVHDFSCVDYATHSKKPDRIRIINGRSIGYDLYSALVLNARGQPLGPVVQELRTEHGCLSSESDEPLPFESHLQQVERAIDAARRKLSGRERVHVADREFDDVHLQRWIADTEDKFVIRVQHLSRHVRDFAGHTCKVADLIAATPLVPAGTVERQGVRYDVYRGETPVQLFAPARRGITASKRRGTKQPRPQPGTTLSLRLVIAELRNTSTNEVLRWALLTNLDDPIEAVVQVYLWRWHVERLFYLVKVGFRLEQWRQETGERIARRLALSSLAAMVIYQLQAAEGRADIDATLKAVATFGGWLNRKKQPIGPIVLMRGIQILLSTLVAVERFGIDGLRRMAEQLGLGFALPTPAKRPVRRFAAISPLKRDV